MPNNHDLVILYDFLSAKGGAERVHFELCRALNARGVVGYVDRTLFPDVTCDSQRDLNAFSKIPALRMLRLMRAFRSLAHELAPAAPKLFAGSYSVLARNPMSAGRTLYYCHTPPRFLYDLRDYYYAESGVGMRLGLRAFSSWFRPRYEDSVRSMDVVLANSSTTQARLIRYLNLNVDVVYPPVNTKAFKWQSDQGYFVSTGRHEPLKRVDLVIEAFKKTPSLRLVVASGGSQTSRLRLLARGCDNITFTGWQSEEALIACIGNARATIYLAVDEDFGMSPVESMAAGKPVIASAEGGLCETIVEGATGLLLSPPPSIDAVINAVASLSCARAASMRGDCEKQAEKFSRQRFVAAIRERLL